MMTSGELFRSGMNVGRDMGLSSSMGVILTVPFTSLIAAIFLAEKSKVKSP